MAVTLGLSERYQQFVRADFEGILQKMPLQEKLGQLFMTYLVGQKFNDEALETFHKSKLGNVICYASANGLTDPQQTKEFIDQIQKVQMDNVGIPAIVAVDQEGGSITHLTKKFTEFPGNRSIAATGEPDLAYHVARAMAQEMRAVDFNLNFAPVVDAPREDSFLAARGYSREINKIVLFADKTIQGYHKEGIFVTKKHYPNHGKAVGKTGDSHVEIPQLELTEKELYEEMDSFFSGEKPDALMTAHIEVKVNEWNQPEFPTFSEKLYQIARKRMGGDCIFVTDSLTMASSLLKTQSTQEKLSDPAEATAESAIKAFIAGADLLLFNFSNVTPEKNRECTCKVLELFKKAVIEKRISEERVDESLRRILKLKHKSMLQGQAPDLSVIKCKEHVELSQNVAQKALTMISPKDLFSSYDTKLLGRRVVLVAPESLKENVLIASSDYKPDALHFYPYNDPAFSDEALILASNKLEEAAKEADLVLFLSHNGHVWKKQNELLKKLSVILPKNKLIAVGLRNPSDVMEGAKEKYLTYLTYSPDAASLKAFFSALENREIPPGKLS